MRCIGAEEAKKLSEIPGGIKQDIRSPADKDEQDGTGKKDQDNRLTNQMVRLAQTQTSLCIKANSPYGPEDGVTHTLGLHGNRNGLLNAMIEVKNDLLGNVEKCQEMAFTLATLISESATYFGYTLPLRNDYAAIP